MDRIFSCKSLSENNYLQFFELIFTLLIFTLLFFFLGGFHEDWRRSRPLVVTYVRSGGPADR